MADTQTVRKGDVVFYSQGGSLFLNKYLYVYDAERHGSDPNQVTVMSFTSGYAGWSFGANREDLEVIGHIDPERVICLGDEFHPDSLDEIMPDVRRMIEVHEAT